MIFSVHDECLYCVSTIFKFFHEKPVFFYPFMKSFCLWERELIVLFPLVEFSCICIFQSGMSSNWNWQYSCSVQRNAVNVRFGMVRIQGWTDVFAAVIKHRTPTRKSLTPKAPKQNPWFYHCCSQTPKIKSKCLALWHRKTQTNSKCFSLLLFSTSMARY